MSRERAFLFVLLVWTLIYLPRLGTLELKSEEGRRVLPAVTMLQTGNYVVPQVGSEPYLRKPPLVNWLVAGSFKLFGMRNEWAARLPSVLSVLLVGCAFLAIAGRALGPNGSLAAAMMWLTNFGLLEKGRLIEIEALYVSLTALAFICWLSWWDQPRKRWLAWCCSGIFLGLALLAKGPLALLFFYAVVIAVLWQAGELRQLVGGPHWLGVALMLSIFSAWGIPYLEMTQAGHAAGVWSRQFSGRLSGEDFKLGEWLLNIPRGIAYLLPWVALFPFARFMKLESDAARGYAKAMSLGAVAPFIAVSLVPGALPRYNLPLLAPAIWLLALFVREHALVWPLQLRRAITWTVTSVTGAMLIYSLAIIPVLKSREKVRPIARKLEAAIPPNETLYAVDPDYQPYLFYLRRPIGYVSTVDDLPARARFVLVQPKNEKTAEESQRWQPRKLQPILRIKDYRGKRVSLLEAK
ncbi:MAG TPA: glycosyltransferase family 39 protein [Chthoniobacterales bacterium]|jgi:4-amino-4-deoxy-L-arabinose transferase-like glycosyltransferase